MNSKLQIHRRKRESERSITEDHSNEGGAEVIHDSTQSNLSRDVGIQGSDT